MQPRDIGKVKEKLCSYCGKPIFMWMGDPNKPGYHLGCQSKAAYIRRKAKRGARKLSESKLE